MKRTYLLAATLLLLTSTAFAQHRGQNRIYEPQTVIINLGAGLFSYDYGPSGLKNETENPMMPGALTSLEYGLMEGLSFGGFFGYGKWNYTTPLVNSTIYESEVMTYGGKLTLHYLGLMNKLAGYMVDEYTFDLYLSAYAGMENQIFSSSSLAESNFKFYPTAGIKANINYNVGGYLEIGKTPMGYVSAGLSLRF